MSGPYLCTMRPVVILFLLLWGATIHAQDSGPVRRKLSPSTAALLSTVLPGAGQVYNGKTWWWKIPVIYGAGAGFTYGVWFYHEQYKAFRDAYRYRIGTGSSVNGVPRFDRFQTPTLLTYRDSYKESRDQCAIGLIIVYTLQILDASVEAHLLEFDINDDLSLKVQPVALPYHYATYTGIQFNLILK